MHVGGYEHATRRSTVEGPSNIAQFARNTSAGAVDGVDASFRTLLALPELDAAVARDPEIAADFERGLELALRLAYSCGDAEAHLVLQRILYRVNRMKLFWYDDLSAYENERSEYVRRIRTRVEDAWQTWESAQTVVDDVGPTDVVRALTARAAEDLSPATSDSGAYFRDTCSVAGYRRLLEIFSLDALVEASQLSRTLGGVTNEIHMVMTKLLLEEYGNGKTARKHSSYFAAMLAELGMNATPEGYFDSAPWETLATINHSFLVSERKRFYLRYVGGLLYTEVSTPAAFASYQAAAERLGLHGGAMDYWQLHIREDERHGRWMLDEVARPLARRYPDHARELVFGYDEQRRMSARGGASLARAARSADADAAHVDRAARSMAS